MADPLKTLTDLLIPVFSGIAGDGTVGDPVVRPSDRADAQVNGALPLAKQVGANPREIAQRVVDADVLCGICDTVEIAGPGFINVTFTAEFLAGQLSEVIGDERLGVPETATPRTIVIDYSAPNVAKEMHAGHLRTTVIGDALARILDFCGNSVIRENHIGDWGRPFGMLIEHLQDIGEDVAAEGMAQGDLDAFYKAANTKFDADEAFQQRSRERVVLLQAYDPDTMAIWQRLVDMSTDYFNTVYTKLGVLLTDDDLMGESKYQSGMGDVMGRLESAGLLQDSDGAKVVFPDGFTNRDNEPLPLIVQARTGGFNYATSDLACVIDRVERLGADTMLYVVGAPQAQHFEMVFAVARLAGWMDETVEATHVKFGSVLGEDRKMLKSRTGGAVKLVELIDESVVRAQATIAEKNPGLADDERAELARVIGVGALKYADLSTDRIKDYVFDWDRMLAFEGNTAPYLQYAHARICSILRKGDVTEQDAVNFEIQVSHDNERQLAQRLLAYPSVIDDVLDTYAPHKLCTYLFDLAQDYTGFYESCPVLKADEAVKNSRLAICVATARTLRHGLGLLGIVAPSSM